MSVEATRGRELAVSFTGTLGIGGSGRCNQIVEVWLFWNYEAQ